jgi:hypothetical protein
MIVAPSFHKRIKLVVYLILRFAIDWKFVGIFRGMQMHSHYNHKAFVASFT